MQWDFVFTIIALAMNLLSTKSGCKDVHLRSWILYIYIHNVVAAMTSNTTKRYCKHTTLPQKTFKPNLQIVAIFKEKKGLNCLTVVHTAIFETTKSWGKLRVNCDSVNSPNILYPITATPAYNTVQTVKLH